MTKTLDDYMKDPDLTNEPEALREVHAIRLKIHDERKGMTTAEYNAIVHQKAARFLAIDNPHSSVARVTR
ncbi:MAG: hypothetical protein FWF55_07355 [Treponema sp.]|nr:hypothetical protein [Treponema sp.]